MSRVRDAISGIRTRLAALDGSIGEAVTAVAAAPKELSPEQVISVLSPVREKVGGVRDETVGTLTKIEEAKQLTAAVLRGGQPGPMISALDAGKQALILVAQCSEHVHRLLTELDRSDRSRISFR